MDGVVRPGRGRGGFGQVSPSHVGLGGWIARPAIVGGRDKPCAVQNLILFSLQRCGFLVKRPGLFFVFAPRFCVFALRFCVFVPPSVYLRRRLSICAASLCICSYHNVCVFALRLRCSAPAVYLFPPLALLGISPYSLSSLATFYVSFYMRTLWFVVSFSLAVRLVAEQNLL